MIDNETILDIPSIQKNVHTRHEKFIKEFGPAAEKVMADHKLFADLIMAKLYRIVLVFKEEKVIDEVKTTEDGPCKKLALSKTGNVTYVNIVTNGIVVVLEGFTYTSGTDTDFRWPNEKFFRVNSKDFDWNNFSIKLLDYIHSTIYERQEAMETRLNFVFGAPFEDIMDERKSKKSKTDK